MDAKKPRKSGQNGDFERTLKQNKGHSTVLQCLFPDTPTHLTLIYGLRNKAAERWAEHDSSRN